MNLKMVWFLAGCVVGSFSTAAVAYVLSARQASDRDQPADVASSAIPTPQLPAAQLPDKPVAMHQPDPSTASLGAPSAANEPNPDCPAYEVANPAWLQSLAKVDEVRLELLPVPKGMDKRIWFWKQIWGKHPNHVFLLVDERRPWILHRAVDCRDLLDDGVPTRVKEKRCERRIDGVRAKVTSLLRQQRNHPHRNLLKAFGHSRSLARTAWKSVIMVEGRRGSLTEALERARPYLADVERIFATEGLPPASARMVIIESLAHPEIKSPAGAVGAFQLVSNTAREYLMVDEHVDERLDPLRAGWAAAQYLRWLQERFKSWPLTITAYNTGPTRLRKVIKHRRTRNLTTLADRGDHGSFGFDGQNYYAQLAAVVELTVENAVLSSASRRAVITFSQPLPLSQAAACLSTSPAKLAAANPALLLDEQEGTIPAGYHLEVPHQGQAVAVP